MFEWKPPDPRLIAFVRRLEAAVSRRFGGTSPAMTSPSAADDARDHEGPSDDAAHDGTNTGDTVEE